MGVTRELPVELQSVFQQRALHWLNLGNVLESLCADPGQHSVHGLAGLLQIGHGLKPAALGQVSLVLEADGRDRDDNRNRNRGRGRCATERCDRRMAVNPFNGPLNRVGRACADRFAGEEAPQVLRKLSCRPVARLRLPVQAVQADRFEVARQALAEL